MRYEMSYTSGATGYGWEKETDNRDEAVYTAREFSKSYTAYFDVWDNVNQEFIYLKRVLTFEPEIDKL